MEPCAPVRHAIAESLRRRLGRGIAGAAGAAFFFALPVARADDARPAVDPASPPPAIGPVAAPPPEIVARPPPLHVDFLQYGVALTINTALSPGAVCGSSVGSKTGVASAPCILGSGGGLAIRGGYRSPGPWYIGGAYEFTKMDSANLYRLGIFQQFRFELRYIADTGTRATPFVTWGVGGVLYGNEWGAETAGALAFAGGGVELEVSRTAVVGITGVYRPALIVGWTDTAGFIRPTGVAQFLGVELRLEVRTELNRR